jgi:hypothetical protein
MKKQQPAKKAQQSEQVSRWNVEFEAARKDVEKWHARGAKIVKRFKDERDGRERDRTRWNLFSSNVQTQMALLYGQVPKVDVSRRFGDAQDDDARVAAIILERCLNCDIEAPTDTYSQALWHALQDRMLPGMGMARIRYEREERPAEPEESAEPVELAEGEEEPLELVKEAVVVDYVPWKCHLWSPAETFQDVRWWAFKTQLGRKQLVARFGAVGELVPLNSAKRKGNDAETKVTPWGRADVWEVWDKENKRVNWYVEGFPQLLDDVDDPLGLDGFWPFARPMCANSTTDSMVPTPDFALAQDLYDEVDDLSTRIKLLQQAVNVRGAYDGTNTGLKRLLSEAAGNELVPVAEFAAFMEKGGIAGAIAWMPLDIIVQAIEALVKQRFETKQALFEITGMSDIMRGQSGEAEATATEQSIKAKFGSVRMQALQGDFARFASDTQRLKAEVMSKFYEPATLLELSNIEMTADAEFAPKAVELIKSRFGMYRVEVKPESVSMADFAAMRSEATEFVTGVSTFLTACAPLIEKIPGSATALLELLGLVMARFHGFGNEAEGIVDRAIATLKAQQAEAAANPQPAPPDPKLQAQQVKSQTELQKVTLEHQADMERIAAETQAEASKQQMQAQFNVQELQAKAALAVQQAHAMPKKPEPKGAPQ